MNILVITEKDAANASLAKITNEMASRGFCITLCPVFESEMILRVFQHPYELVHFKDLNSRKINDFDAILTSTAASDYIGVDCILNCNIPIYTHNYLINNQLVFGGDICFETSLSMSESKYTHKQSYFRIETGDPKYDELEKNEKGEGILFIDSGHFPFGKEGKMALADFLLEVCNKCPNITVTVKPRFLPGEEIVTHYNKDHLYDYVRRSKKKKPENLILLNEHNDLSQLINQCATVICMYTTAFLGAITANKGLVMLDEVPSEDSYDLRLKDLYRIRDNVKKIGAVIDYKKAIDYMPNGIKSKEDGNTYAIGTDKKSAKMIVDVIEENDKKYFSKALFPDYMIMKEDNEKSPLFWHEIHKRRLVDYFIWRALIQIDFHVKAEIDTQMIDIEITKFLKEMQEGAIYSAAEINKRARAIRDLCIIENEQLMKLDEIDYGVLINAYFLQGLYEKINHQKESGLGATLFFKARVAHEEGDSNRVKEYIDQYFQIVRDRAYVKEISDMPGNRAWAEDQR